MRNPVAMLVAIFMALAGPLAIAYGGYWWAMDRPAWHVGWCPFCVGWGPGAGQKLRAMQTAEEAAARRAAMVVAKQSAVTVQAQKNEVAAQVQIRTVYRTIHDEVPVYVTPQTDRAFPLSVGFVRLLDAGALGLDVSGVSGPPGLADDAPSPDAPSVVAANQLDNDRICRSNAELAGTLQAWIRGEANAAVGN